MWTAPERRWRDAVLDAALPGRARPPSSLGPDDWERWDRAADPLLRWGFRAAVWAFTWAPVVRYGRPFHRLDPDRRDAALAAVAGHRSWTVRQVALVVHLVAGLAAARAELDPGTTGAA